MKIAKNIGILFGFAAACCFTGCAEMIVAAGQGINDGIDQALGGGGDDGGFGVTDDFADAGDDDFVIVDHGGPTVDVRCWTGDRFQYWRFPRGKVAQFRRDFVRITRSNPSAPSYRKFKRMHPQIAMARERARYSLTHSGGTRRIGGGASGQRAITTGKGKKKEKQ